MKPAGLAHQATRLDLLEQKFDALPPPGEGGGGADPDLVERIFDDTFAGSYVAPNEEGAVASPPSSNDTIYDILPGHSLHRAVFGTSGAGGYSYSSELSYTVSFWDQVFGEIGDTRFTSTSFATTVFGGGGGGPGTDGATILHGRGWSMMQAIWGSASVMSDMVDASKSIAARIADLEARVSALE